jgi:hypothetical protein
VWPRCCSDKRQNPEAEYVNNVVVLRIDGMLSFLNAEVGARRGARDASSPLCNGLHGWRVG